VVCLKFKKLLEHTPFINVPALAWVAAGGQAPLKTQEAGSAWSMAQDKAVFELRRQQPLPGWHMLEVELAHDQASAAVCVVLDSGDGFDEDNTLYLTLRSGRVAKRLVFLPWGTQALRFEVLLPEGAFFGVKHWRLVWLPPWFAHDRLAQRLVSMNHRFRDTPKSEVLKKIRDRARAKGVSWRQWALLQYEQTFERRSIRTSYNDWLQRQEVLTVPEAQQAMVDWQHKPLISIILPVFNPNPEHLKQCLDSVLGQHYANWQLCVVDDASTDQRVRPLLARYAGADARVKVFYRPKNGHICEASNSALSMAQGEFVALLDHDDVLSADALFEVVKAIQQTPDAGLIYSDEDKINDDGERFDPHFKSGWNPDLLLAQNCVSHLGVYNTQLVREVGGFRPGFEGSQDHDLALRLSARLAPKQIVHVAKVLYHWRAAEGSTALGAAEKHYTSKAGLMAVRERVAQIAPQAQVKAGIFPNTYRVDWPLPKTLPMVSLLVPTRDKVDVLQPCVDAILRLTTYPNFELLILDNQSTCHKSLAYLKAVTERDSRVRVLSWNAPFNFSAINNFGVTQANGSIVGLINNDIEPIHGDWLEAMVRQVSRPEIGCVGAKLYYPNDTVQHAGVVLGIGGVAGHAHKYFSRNSTGYFMRLQLAHNLSAVTGACLLVRKSVYQEVGGMDEQHLKVAFNDVDLCLKVREAGYRNVFTPYAELYHHESASRGANDTWAKRALANAEAAFMRQKWGRVLDTDPYYNPNLTLVYEDFSLN